jgi:CheY-like chemotaxis protein
MDDLRRAPWPVTLPVLVVDHDAANRLLHATALGRAGLRTIEASNATAALEIIESERVGVVVTDNAMPGMSGIDMVRALRSRTETATLPVILVTGSGHNQTVIEVTIARRRAGPRFWTRR